MNILTTIKQALFILGFLLSSSHLDDISENPRSPAASLHLSLHVSKQLPTKSFILFSLLIGDTGRPSLRDSSGAFPIRVFRRKWPSFPFSSIGPGRCQSVPLTVIAVRLSGSLCLLSPPSYWLREAAATTAEKEDPHHDEERAFAALDPFSLLKTFDLQYF